MNDLSLNTANLPTARRKVLLSTAMALVLGGAVVATLVPSPPPANAQPVVIDQPVQLPSFADVVDQVAPAVVGILAKGERETRVTIPGLENLPPGTPLERFFQDMPQQTETRPTTSMGSGFFVSQDGYIVTNNHVVDGADEFTVILNDGTELTAHIVGTDDLTDLALLKVDADRDFRYVEFADADVRVGDWAIAVGTPFGLGGTVTAGIVSATARTIGNSAYDDFIQIDAAVNQGNSGGPTFNLAGQVVGVNTAIYSPTGGNVGIAFAVPSKVAAAIVADLRDHGSVQRGWLGVQIQPVTPAIAAALGLDTEGGALIAAPLGNGPAEAAGLQSRDVVLAINGEAVEDQTDFARRIGALDPNTEVTLSIFRDGETIDLTVTLGTMPAEGARVAQNGPAPTQPEEAAQPGIGLSVAQLRDGGVVIAQINPNGTAAEAGLREGDVIVAVGNDTIESTADVRAAVDAAREAGRESILFQINRDGGTLIVAVQL